MNQENEKPMKKEMNRILNTKDKLNKDKSKFNSRNEPYKRQNMKLQIRDVI